MKELGVEGVYTRLLNGDLQKLNYDFPVSKRHITLDKLISASYNLLKKNEQTLFRRLGIFSGSVGVFGVRGSIKAVATICNLGDLPTDELHLINSLKALANHNLVIFADELTGIAHATIRDYALLKLLKDKDENAKINIKFLIYYLITFDKEALVFDSETESLKLREKSTEQTGSILQALAMRMQMIDLLLLNFLVLQP